MPSKVFGQKPQISKSDGEPHPHSTGAAVLIRFIAGGSEEGLGGGRAVATNRMFETHS